MCGHYFNMNHALPVKCRIICRERQQKLLTPVAVSWILLFISQKNYTINYLSFMKKKHIAMVFLILLHVFFFLDILGILWFHLKFMKHMYTFPFFPLIASLLRRAMRNNRERLICMWHSTDKLSAFNNTIFTLEFSNFLRLKVMNIV